ncbi:MAG: hypothetical protein Q7R94_00510 [bacterium]|nr:hypothetical protein [bacterium]
MVEITVTTIDVQPFERKGFAKIVFVAINREGGLELRKLYAEFVGAEYSGKDTYLDYDGIEFGQNCEVRKLTLIIGGGQKETKAFMMRDAYAFAKRVQGNS